jgi:hypothetical protein
MNMQNMIKSIGLWASKGYWKKESATGKSMSRHSKLWDSAIQFGFLSNF